MNKTSDFDINITFSPMLYEAKYHKEGGIPFEKSDFDKKRGFGCVLDPAIGGFLGATFGDDDKQVVQ